MGGVLGILLFLGFVGGLFGCEGGSSPGFEVIPISEEVEVRKGGSEGWRYVEEGDRLEFETQVVEETATPAPAEPPVVGAGVGVLEAAVRGRGVLPGGTVKEVGVPPGLGCVEHYRWLLKGYWGRRPFGPETAVRLSEDMVADRPECVDEGGWSPVFSFGPVCDGGTVDGVQLSSRLVRLEGSLRERRALSTGKDLYGNILVQFEKMPLREEGGCWYYRAHTESWSWVVLGVGTGTDLPRYPVCEDRLREKVLAGDVRELRVLDVAGAVEEVKRELGAECGSGNWSIYPSTGPAVECDVQAVTGVGEDGLLVLNWQEQHPASDGAVCWVHDLGGGEWSASYKEAVP